MQVFYIDRGGLRERGEGMPRQGFLMFFTSESSPAAEVSAVPLGACRHPRCGCKGGLAGTSMAHTTGIWHCLGASLEDP